MIAQPPVVGLTRDGAHNYTALYPPAAPVELASVTTVIGVLAKPALLNWYGKIAATWAVDNVELMVRIAADLGRDAAIKAIAARGAGERDRKAAIGTRAHGAIEALLAGMPVITDPDTAPLVAQYRRFVADWKFKPEWSEAMIVGAGYGGTFDLVGKLAGRRALIDVKTGSFIAPEMGLQLAAYRHATYIGRPGTTDRWRMPAVELCAVLQLQPTFYRLIPFAVGDAEYRAFLAALDVYRWFRQQGRSIVGQPLAMGSLKIA